MAVNLLVFNWPLLGYVFENTNVFAAHGLKALVLMVVVVHAITFIFFAFVSLLSINLLKLTVIMITAANTVAWYFMLNYQVLFDKAMMGNVFNTRYTEASEFLTAKLVVVVLIVTLVPAYLITKIRIIASSRLTVAKHMGIHMLATVSIAYMLSSTWLWVDQHAKYLGGYMLPWSYVANSFRYHQAVSAEKMTQTWLPKLEFIDHSKQLVVLVIGETARAQNFSLYGYDKNTNPKLSQEHIKVLPNTKSCATYTTASIACMLSHQQTTGMYAQQFEPLPSYLTRHGVKVVWRTNNWGEPKINVSKYQKAEELRPNCTASDCDYDGVLLSGLEELIRSTEENKMLLVIHQKGSHGPLYYQRYPNQFNLFKPVCQTVELSKCLESELINAYDNSILYTDHLLASIINSLKRQSDFESTLIYISDHGESLGEEGLYLHGTPMAIAPEVQYQIPFIIWNSAAKYPATNHATEYSHHNIFHSVLGSLGAVSEVYEASLDVFK